MAAICAGDRESKNTQLAGSKNHRQHNRNHDKQGQQVGVEKKPLVAAGSVITQLRDGMKVVAGGDYRKQHHCNADEGNRRQGQPMPA